jgi:Tol biopolymer transport system component
VWIVRRDGSGLRRLTAVGEDDPSVAWSPDGGWLALRGGDGLSLVERDTGRVVRLASGADQGPIDWGP